MLISIIVPCFNETANIQKGVMDKIGNYTKDNPIFLEVIIADDGSTDESIAQIKRDYLPRFPKFKLLELTHGGKANTVIAGTHVAKGDYVFLTDADLATPIEDVSKLIDKYNETKSEIIIGSRGSVRKDAPLSRQILALGMIILRSVLVGLHDVKDTQCGFKLFKRDMAEDIFKKLRVFRRKQVNNQASVSAIFDLEFLYLAQKYGHQIQEVPVTWRHVETRRVSFVKDAIESLLDMARLKWYDILGRYNA